MEAAHEGLGLSNGDFDALLEDVAVGLAAAGVSGADIDTLSPTLLDMEEDIVELESEETTESECIEDPADAGMDDAGLDAGDAG
jgi:hypothetical protein